MSFIILFVSVYIAPKTSLTKLLPPFEFTALAKDLICDLLNISLRKGRYSLVK